MAKLTRKFSDRVPADLKVGNENLKELLEGAWSSVRQSKGQGEESGLADQQGGKNWDTNSERPMPTE